MSEHRIWTATQLRERYGFSTGNAPALRILDKHHRAFIALSPFVVMASVDTHGRPDLSPRGDQPGFVSVSYANTLLVADRPGNRKLTLLTNILANPIFFVPGRDESLRVNDTAAITTGPSALAGPVADGKAPRSAMRVHVEHSQFVRSHLWSAAHATEDSPALWDMLAGQVGGSVARTCRSASSRTPSDASAAADASQGMDMADAVRLTAPEMRRCP